MVQENTSLFAANQYEMSTVTGPYSVYGVIVLKNIEVSWGDKKRLTRLSQSPKIGGVAVEWFLSKQLSTGENL